jgi:diaminopimelate decarboxylase
MHDFKYINDKLYCENVAVENLVREHGTPLYVYSQKTVTNNFHRFEAALNPVKNMICYSVKANSNAALIRALANVGSGFDVVSQGELRRVVGAGADPQTCVFAGVCKTEEEIEFGLEQKIYAFNVESEPELERINRIAGKRKVVAPISIRVNPNVDANSHSKITTGTYANKFGIPFEEVEAVYAAAKKLKNIKLRGIQMHIGSQITETKPFELAIKKMAPLIKKLTELYGLEFFSIGGGIGIVYEQAMASGAPEWWQTDAGKKFITPESYAATILPLVQPLGLRILVEPGRFIVGNAGILITRVEYVKKTGNKQFVMVDAGMNDLIRPAMYDAYHEIVPVAQKGGDKVVVDVVGPVCESGDSFCHERLLPKCAEGDLLAIMSAGAYGLVMASNYNSRPLAAEVLVQGRLSAICRFRQYAPRMWESEKMPRWLKFVRLPSAME